VDRRGIGAGLGGNLVFDVDGEQALTAHEEVMPVGLVLELAARGAGARLQGSRASAGALSARLHWAMPRSGAWLATSGFEVDPTRGMLPLIGAGAWVERGRLTLTTQLVHLLDRLRSESSAQAPRPDSSRGGPEVDAPIGTSEEDTRLMTGAETSLTWALDRWDLQSRAGFAVSLHHRPARWGELRADYHLRNGLGLFGRVRSTTRVPTALEAQTETNGAVGVQLAIGAGPALRVQPRSRGPEFTMRPLGGSRYRLTLELQGSIVEVSSDATEWVSLAATRVATDRWEVELDLSPGVHRIASRVDGVSWRAPAGLPSTLDEFGGEVGLIVVQ
jgi:hypothetical protein